MGWEGDCSPGPCPEDPAPRPHRQELEGTGWLVGRLQPNPQQVTSRLQKAVPGREEGRGLGPNPLPQPCLSLPLPCLCPTSALPQPCLSPASALQHCRRLYGKPSGCPVPITRPCRGSSHFPHMTWGGAGPRSGGGGPGQPVSFLTSTGAPVFTQPLPAQAAAGRAWGPWGRQAQSTQEGGSSPWCRCASGWVGGHKPGMLRREDSPSRLPSCPCLCSSVGLTHGFPPSLSRPSACSGLRCPPRKRTSK